MEDPAQSNTFWICYLCCNGLGITNFGSPLCKEEGKCICVKGGGECDCVKDVMNGGLVAVTGKTCCCLSMCQFFPKTVFIEFCGMRLVGGPKPTAGAGFNFGNNAVAVSIHEEQELKSIQKELKEAIEKEDFDMAKELKNKRDDFAMRLRQNAGAIPSAMSMV